MTDRQPGYLTGRYVEAFRWALKVHDGQTRYNTGTAYISHLMITSAHTLEAGADEDVAIAALLHDVVEDQGVLVSEVAVRFGSKVAGIVADCTDVTSDLDRRDVSWLQRKMNHAERMRAFGIDSLLVIAADKIASLQGLTDDIAVYGMDLFSKSDRSAEELLWNYTMILEVLEEKRIPPALLARLRQLASQLRQVIDP
jgi:(p)ppGpp synthase/HD superfamily hydrolase